MNKYVLHIKSLDKITLFLYITFLKTIFRKINLLEYKIISLPYKKKRITLLKSPHVNKKAREQFEIRVYKTIISFNFSKNYIFLNYILINKPKNIKLNFQIN